jgi:hypothetical protein
MNKLKELERRLHGEPNNLGLRVMVACALHEAGRREDAIELYRSAAVAYRDQGRDQQAIAVCHSILALAPGDAQIQELLAGLGQRQPGGVIQTSAPAMVDRLTPPPLPKPPRPGSARPDGDGDGDGDGDAVPSPRPSIFDLTPLPAPMPYHLVDDPASSPLAGSPSHLAAVSLSDLPTVAAADLPASLHDGRTRHPQLAGIASAARQISASLIAAHTSLDEDVSGELETRRLPRITAAELLKISGPPPALATGPIAVPEPIDNDDEPTLLPPSDYSGRPLTTDDELTEPRELPSRTRPPSITPLSTATGPLAGAFFVPIPQRNRAGLLQRFRRRMATSGSTVIRRGELGHGLVIVVRGLLEVHAERPGGSRIVLGAIAPGEFIGEASLLARGPAAVTVVAAVDSELLVLGEAEFYEITSSFPALWSELKHTAERRLREHEQRLNG